MEDPEQNENCIVCNRPTYLFCNSCELTGYCSQECQQTDFPTHGLFCPDFSNLELARLEGRPRRSILAILFPVDHELPIPIWLPCRRIGLDAANTDARGRRPIVEHLLPHRLTIKRDFIRTDLVLARELSDTICLCYCDFNDDWGLDTNKSIEKITATGPGQYSKWEGTVIAYGKTGLDLGPSRHRDLWMDDFRHIADYFLSCGFNLALPKTPCSLPNVKAVRINCMGDKILNRPQFEQIELPANDPIFTVHDTSNILDRIDVPVSTQRCAPDPRWEEYLNSYANPYARFLHLHCNPKTTTGDKKPLSSFHAEALCKYCCEVSVFMDKAPLLCRGGDFMTREFAASMICRPLFTIFRNKLIHEKLEKHEDVDDMTCPYRV
ncbi:hypothetical protein F4860DRAFT_516165 [Xylaria cubensis]|nr:hypothetical protein F4860DRAFT_516165 [Xylaria cubensis]